MRIAFSNRFCFHDLWQVVPEKVDRRIVSGFVCDFASYYLMSHVGCVFVFVDVIGVSTFINELIVVGLKFDLCPS